ncbi:MAG: winged helix-turn-helix domain-containing protein [Rhodobacteraceae bacterium]|nr:winged helix-turn-helix domain-containing protein [Paracoccaceae bacterium]
MCAGIGTTTEFDIRIGWYATTRSGSSTSSTRSNSGCATIYLRHLSADQPETGKTQCDLAGLPGCARQTLNRALGRLRDRHIIAMEKGKTRVLDRQVFWAQAHAPERASQQVRAVAQPSVWAACRSAS